MLKLEPKIFYIEEPEIGSLYIKDKKHYLCVGLYKPVTETDIEQLDILLQNIIVSKNAFFVAILAGYLTKVKFRAYVKEITFSYLLYCKDTDEFYRTTKDKTREQLLVSGQNKDKKLLKTLQQSDVILPYKETVDKVDMIVDKYYENVLKYKIKGKKNTILLIVETYLKDKAMQTVEEYLNKWYCLEKKDDQYFFTQDSKNAILSRTSSIKDKEYYAVRYYAYYIKKRIS